MKNHHTAETFVETLENNVETILQQKKELPRNNVLKVIKAYNTLFYKMGGYCYN